MDPWNSLQIPWGGKKKKPLLTTHFIFLSGNKVSWKTYWKSLKSQCWNIKQISLRKYTKLWFIRGKKKKNNICLDMIYWKGERIIRGKLNLLLFLSWCIKKHLKKNLNNTTTLELCEEIKRDRESKEENKLILILNSFISDRWN